MHKPIVKLISYSQGATEDANLELQELIAYCARVSNPSNQNNHETSEKLIRYLIKNKHWSPLEMVSACVEITTTRDIARQILRHRSFSFQEFSQRYADPTKSLNLVTREARLQDTKNRQNSISLHSDSDLHRIWEEIQRDITKRSLDAYYYAIRNGIAKEQARAVLPEGLTESRLYMSGTIRSFIHYVEIRTSSETQKEHREVARAIADCLIPIFPLMKEFVSC